MSVRIQSKSERLKQWLVAKLNLDISAMVAAGREECPAHPIQVHTYDTYGGKRLGVGREKNGKRHGEVCDGRGGKIGRCYVTSWVSGL